MISPGTHRVGTSGWAYRSWRGPVYPTGLASSRWLEHYAARFTAVEVNATFYRLARREVVARWAAVVPDDFRFVVKGSRFLTHVKRLDDLGPGLERFFAPLAPLGEKLEAVLWQLPPTLPLDLERLALFLSALPPPVAHAVEFRHPSWQDPAVDRLLDDAGVMTVAVSGPQLPARHVVTGGRAYVRFHGLTPGYQHDYTAEELAPWAEWVADGPGALVFFNNDAGGAAVRDAERFAALLEERQAAGRT